MRGKCLSSASRSRKLTSEGEKESSVLVGEMRAVSSASNCNRREMDALAGIHQPSLRVCVCARARVFCLCVFFVVNTQNSLQYLCVVK